MAFAAFAGSWWSAPVTATGASPSETRLLSGFGLCDSGPSLGRPCPAVPDRAEVAGLGGFSGSPRLRLHEPSIGENPCCIIAYPQERT
jgi:hypothetical protein